MILYGVLAMLCLVAGFGLGWYEYDLRWKIVTAVHLARPDLQPYSLFTRARSLGSSEVHTLYRAHFPQGRLIARRRIAFFAAPACFLLGALFLVLAYTHS